MNRVGFKRKSGSGRKKKDQGRTKRSSGSAGSEMAGSSQPPKTFPEVPFLICRKRKNQPMIFPVIGQKRCRRIQTCQEYFDYLQPAMFGRYEKRGLIKRKKLRDPVQASSK